MHLWIKPRNTLLAIVFAFIGAPLSAQDTPDLTRLPVLTAPGTLAAQALPDQGFWLDVAQPGLYHLTLDGPAMLGLTDFDTANGRSDGSDRQERILQDGSAYATGHLDDLLLVPGHAYLMQIAGLMPRGVTLVLDQPIDPTTALTGDTIPGLTPEAPLVLDVSSGSGQSILLRPDGPLTLHLTAPQGPVLRLDLLTPPRADRRDGFDDLGFGVGGIFPVGPFDAARISIEGRPGPDGAQPLYLLRATALPDPKSLDENEPGVTDLGPLPSEGRSLRAVLLANSDHDSFQWTVTKPATLDLSIEVQGGSRNALTLRRDDTEVLSADLEEGRLFRPGLTLPPGAYQLDISGDQDKPQPYTITLAPSATASEGEPDDRPDLARTLAIGKALRGTLGPGNPGHARFKVTVPGHLWELRGVQGISNLDLVDGNDTQIGAWEATSGALVLRLALPPGEYVARLRGDGPYALRLSDAGRVPEGFEVEPDDSDASAIRLKPGMQVTGDFQTAGDTDFYEFTLAAPTPLNITVTGPDDGPVVVDLFAADAGSLRAELPMGAAPVSYAGLYPAGRYVMQLRAREGGISGRYRLQIDRTNQPEPEEPTGVAAMPGDGVIAGRIGGFDVLDQVFMPLPQGSGSLALACQGASSYWEVMTFGDETRLARAERGETVVLPYDPQTGGALALQIHGDVDKPTGSYDCRLRFAPGASAQTLPSVTHDEALDEGEPSALLPGSTITGRFDSDRDRDTIVMGLEAGRFAGLRCDVPVDRLRGEGALRAALDTPVLEGDIHPVLAGSDPMTLEINPPSDGVFPLNWTCSLLDDAAFSTPAMMGPSAPLTGYRDPAADPATAIPFDPATTLHLLSGGRPDWLNPTQVTNDLAVTLQVTGLEAPFAAYDRLGQSADLMLHASNPGAEAMTLRYQLSALADGWRVVPAEGSLTLAPGADAAVPLTLELPPMQSPVNDPQLRVTAAANGRTASLTVPVTLSATAAERDPHRFWTAPEALRGGLNPMLQPLGARLLTLDGQPVDDDTAQKLAFLHDGEALHTGIPGWFRAHEATFQLAETAPVAGLFVDLRTTESRSFWPGLLSLDLSEDGQTWVTAATVTLTASDLPQVFALDRTLQARFARIKVPGCRTDPKCNQIALSEVGLIAPPDWRLSQPVDLADPALGGHVVWAQSQGGIDVTENPFGGNWNLDLLTPGRASDFQAQGERVGDRLVAVIGFHAARAGRIAALEWDGTPDDIQRLGSAEVEVSSAGPRWPLAKHWPPDLAPAGHADRPA